MFYVAFAYRNQFMMHDQIDFENEASQVSFDILRWNGEFFSWFYGKNSWFWMKNLFLIETKKDAPDLHLNSITTLSSSGEILKPAASLSFQNVIKQFQMQWPLNPNEEDSQWYYCPKQCKPKI